MSDYEKYRGKCKEMCEQEVANDPTLTLVRGHYHCPIWGEQEHWWLVHPDGSIVDPTVRQFPSKGLGEYVPWNGVCPCAECGMDCNEETLVRHSGCCSGRCFGRMVGVS